MKCVQLCKLGLLFGCYIQDDKGKLSIPLTPCNSSPLKTLRCINYPRLSFSLSSRNNPQCVSHQLFTELLQLTRVRSSGPRGASVYSWATRVVQSCLPLSTKLKRVTENPRQDLPGHPPLLLGGVAGQSGVTEGGDPGRTVPVPIRTGVK